MNHGSLFSGVGGFDLAARWVGWSNVFQVEIDPFCQKVLQKNFPLTKRYEDVRKFDGTQYRGAIDVISGGFPCQPFSTAGQRKGKDDPRHLWPEMLRIIQEIKPLYIVGENVRGLLSWSGGMVFDDIITDLESAGYEVIPCVLPAAGCNAPHVRQRVWFIAHCNNIERGQIQQREFETPGSGKITSDANEATTSRYRFDSRCLLSHTATNVIGKGNSTVTNPYKAGRSKLITSNIPKKTGQYSRSAFDCWNGGTTQSAVRRVDDGIPNRVDRIAALGNAIVPQIAYRIFSTIQDIHHANQL